VCNPVAIADGRNLEATVTQMPVFHGHFPPDVPTAQYASQ
jgi:hypothetical protein